MNKKRNIWLLLGFVAVSCNERKKWFDAKKEETMIAEIAYKSVVLRSVKVHLMAVF